MCEALAGTVEAQQLGTLHFHGFAWPCNIYQHATLTEIAEAIRKRRLDAEAVLAWQNYVCREEHFDQSWHEANQASMEEQWQQRWSHRGHDAMCALPTYLRRGSTATLIYCS